MSELGTRDRVLAYLTALVAVFCLAYVAGGVVRPDVEPAPTHPGDHGE